LGIAPVQRQALSRGDRYQILLAITSEGILAVSIYKDTTVRGLFGEYFVPRVRQIPAKNSVIVMDNASIHHSERIRQLCTDAGVTLVYLPPYSPDYNPIEEFFSELKAFVRKYWRLYLDTTDRSHGAFRSSLGFCVLEVGKRKKSAQGHFLNAGIPCNG
jgi:transposase